MAAYNRVSGYQVIAGLSLALIPVVAALTTPKYCLGKRQSAAGGTGLDGQKLDILQERRGDADLQDSKRHLRLRDIYRK